MIKFFEDMSKRAKAFWDIFAKGFNKGSDRYEAATKDVNISGSKTFLMIGMLVAVSSLVMGNPWPICGLLAIPFAEKALLPGVTGLIEGCKSLFGGAESATKGTTNNAFKHTTNQAALKQNVTQLHVTPKPAATSSKEQSKPGLQAELTHELPARAI